MFVLSVEPFWGRAILKDTSNGAETVFDTATVYSNDLPDAFNESMDLFKDLKSALPVPADELVATVIEVSASQSEAVRDSLVEAAADNSFGAISLVEFETTSRFLYALDQLPLTKKTPTGASVAVIDAWSTEAFGFILQAVSENVFKPIAYAAIIADDDVPLDPLMLSKLRARLYSQIGTFPSEVIISTEDHANLCRDVFASESIHFYDADERRGSLLKAMSLVNQNRFVVVPTFEAQLKAVIGDLEFAILDNAFSELPLKVTQNICLPANANQVEIHACTSDWALFDVLEVQSSPVPTQVTLCCAIDVDGKCDVYLESL
uniref:DUF1015 family protein n=1 Tax=Panagrellus redivivus TaxID=6233 RepID=A0A7E4VZS4_PANRE